MSTQYRLVQSGKTASGGCSAGQGLSEPVAPWIYLFIFYYENELGRGGMKLFEEL
jgi:carbohydrate-binding DOMON domain-containing protein